MRKLVQVLLEARCYTKQTNSTRSLTSTACRARFQVQLKQRPPEQQAMSAEYKTLKGQSFDRDAFESLIKRKQYYWQSFEPYGATKGLFDYGPPLSALESNMINEWRDHFVRSESMMELTLPALTPYKVLETSGHVAKFADFCSKDPKTGDIHRTDHLIKDILTQRMDNKKRPIGLEERNQYEHILATLDDYTGEQMGSLITRHDIRPASGNVVEPPTPVNLMFQTQIGATGKEPAFLRPETAQGQFLAFPKLVEYMDGQMPMASAAIGYSYRNELSPRSGLLRVREFRMAEIEHFVDPDNKNHVKFASVRHVKVPLLSRQTQQDGKTIPETMTIGDAVDSKLVDNETLGFFIVRIMQFMERIGIDMNKLRFRQHMQNEMAHYAADCWDCELFNSYGWVECVGCADRSAYDLSVHMKATGVPLQVREPLKDGPRKVEEWSAQLDKKKAGPKFKKDAGKVQQALDGLSQDLREKLSISMEKDGKVELDVPEMAGGKAELTKDLAKFEKETKTVTMREYIPNVIEPSFGIGRILYSLMEHSYWTREKDAARSVMSFKPRVAPIKVLVVPLQKDAKFDDLLRNLDEKLNEYELSKKTDRSGVSIGKRYSRNDELGIPCGITVDYQSLEDGTYTLRDRDSTKQVRASLDDILDAVSKIVKGRETFADVQKRLPAFSSSED